MYSDLRNTNLAALPLVPGRTIARRNPVTMIRLPNGRRQRLLPIALYDSALTAAAYGKQVPHLGDLFNDIVGAIVPGWDQRPDWMKKIQVKPDPVKLLQTAQKFVPPSQIQKILGIGQQYGIQPYYGGVPISPEAGAAAYQYGDIAASLASVPTWIYLAGGGVLLLLVMGSARR